MASSSGPGSAPAAQFQGLETLALVPNPLVPTGKPLPQGDAAGLSIPEKQEATQVVAGTGSRRAPWRAAWPWSPAVPRRDVCPSPAQGSRVCLGVGLPLLQRVFPEAGRGANAAPHPGGGGGRGGATRLLEGPALREGHTCSSSPPRWPPGDTPAQRASTCPGDGAGCGQSGRGLTGLGRPQGP